LDEQTFLAANNSVILSQAAQINNVTDAAITGCIVIALFVKNKQIRAKFSRSHTLPKKKKSLVFY